MTVISKLLYSIFHAHFVHVCFVALGSLQFGVRRSTVFPTPAMSETLGLPGTFVVCIKPESLVCCEIF